jgi:hypothetical protein
VFFCQGLSRLEKDASCFSFVKSDESYSRILVSSELLISGKW